MPARIDLSTDWKGHIRFDIVSVTMGEEAVIEHLEDAMIGLREFPRLQDACCRLQGWLVLEVADYFRL